MTTVSSSTLIYTHTHTYIHRGIISQRLKWIRWTLHILDIWSATRTMTSSNSYIKRFIWQYIKKLLQCMMGVKQDITVPWQSEEGRIADGFCFEFCLFGTRSCYVTRATCNSWSYYLCLLSPRTGMHYHLTFNSTLIISIYFFKSAKWYSPRSSYVYFTCCLLATIHLWSIHRCV